MAYELYTGNPYDEQAKVAYFMRLFGFQRIRRVLHETQWEESAALCWPEYRNSFAFGHVRPPGAKYTEFQVDTSGSIAAHRFMSICDALLTPYSVLWSVVRASDPALMRDRAVKEYFSEVTRTLWTARYKSQANFLSQNQNNYHGLGVFGNAYMMIDQLDPTPLTEQGLRYVGCSVGEIYRLVNHQGRTDGFIRHFRWSARQAHQRWGDKIPPALHAALAQNSSVLYDFLQFVIPRTDYDPHKILSPEGKPWSSTYISITGYCILEEGGYRTFPLACGGYIHAPEEDYDRGPAQMVLPSLKTLNAEKGVFLRQGHLAGDPAYLIGDDGLIDFKRHPGSFNYGGYTSDGKPLVSILPTGQIQVTQEMMAVEQKAVDDAFLVSLFPLLFDNKGGQKSAREVIEAANDRGVFLAPTLGRMYGEYLGTMIDRELDLLSYMGKLPKQPPALREAKGEYQIVYTSPLARSLSNQKIAGFMRTVEIGNQVVQVTGNNALMDIFEFDTALQDIGEEQFVPPEWFATAQKIAQARKGRSQAAERERQVKELPGRAAMAKAQAITAKAQIGGNTGGTLSGQPEGAMPMMPGQSTPGGRAFGEPG